MKGIILSVEGMSCGMCEAHINDAVRIAVKVKKVTSSHRKNQTLVIAEDTVDIEAMKRAIEAQGYTVPSVVPHPYEKRGLFCRGKN